MSKSIVIRSLKGTDGLDLFTRLEKLSSKQINCDGSIEFLRLCQSFDLTPTFAKIDETKSKKWTRSLEEFARNVIVEELRNNSQKNITLKKQIRRFIVKFARTAPISVICVLWGQWRYYVRKLIKKWQKTTHQKLHGGCTGILTLMNSSRTFLRTISLSSTNSHYAAA